MPRLFFWPGKRCDRSRCPAADRSTRDADRGWRVGKTRLAIQVAGEISAGYPDGAWLVELAAVRDPAAIAHAAAAVLNVAQQPGKVIEQSLVTALAGRRLLLVLDNCE